MTTRIYNVARQKFALAQINWQTNPFAASIASSSYKADIVNDTNIGAAGGLLATVDIFNRSVDSAGWFVCDPIFFANTPPGIKFSQIVVWRRSDGLLLIQFTFPGFTGGADKPFVVLRGASFPGLFRI